MFELAHRPVAAARALRNVLADPDDTKQVFTLIDTLTGGTAERFVTRFAESRGGMRLLETKPEIIDRLSDRAALAALPEGSLGRAYLAFMSDGQLSAEFLIDASNQGRIHEDTDPTSAYLRRRMRDAHDLWHVVTGYKGDLLGEASLLAFTYSQTWNPGVGLLVASAFLRGRDPDARGLILDGFARGLRAAWLPAAAWEEMLALPLEAVRAQLRVGPPPVYVPFTSSDLAAENARAAA